jgi:gluconokinase
MSSFIGLDLGTTTTKAVALSANGELGGLATSKHHLSSPHTGWAEQPVEVIWRGVLAALRNLASQVPKKDIRGICLSGAMHSLLPVGEDGAPLAPAMTWADERAASKARALRMQTNPRSLYKRTGCPLQATYYPARLGWLADAAPELFHQAALFVSIKDWILFRMTGVWATDTGLASTTGLLDLRSQQWDHDALALAKITPQRLPKLVTAESVVGVLLPEVARSSGLPAGIPVIAGSTDGGLANLGAGVAKPGQAVITVGTSGAIRRVVESPLLDLQERTWCYYFTGKRWFAGGAINNGGLALQWARERFYPDVQGEAGFQRMLADAADVPPGASGALVLPYFTGERSPHWDAEARAEISGLTMEHSRGHIARAVMEGVAFCLADVWEALGVSDKDGQPVRITGGITQSPLWMQIVADVLGVPLAPVEVADASPAGAAMLCQYALDQVENEHKPTTSLEQLAGRVTAGKLVKPDAANHSQYVQIHRRFQKLYHQLKQ